MDVTHIGWGGMEWMDLAQQGSTEDGNDRSVSLGRCYIATLVTVCREELSSSC
jgi:hypothetical protein